MGERTFKLSDEQPGAWLEQARCRGVDPRIFFPERGSPDAKIAMRICGECVVSDDCLAWAIRVGFRDGIFGGKNPSYREAQQKHGVCRICRTEFPVSGTGRPAYCSKECRDEGRHRWHQDYKRVTS